MAERIELRPDISAAEGIRGVRQSREMRPDEARKKFADEFERRMAHEDEKPKAEPEEDEIIIGGNDQDHQHGGRNESENKKEQRRQDEPGASEKPIANKIDLIA